jgi:hypothetical protein
MYTAYVIVTPYEWSWWSCSAQVERELVVTSIKHETFIVKIAIRHLAYGVAIFCAFLHNKLIM